MITTRRNIINYYFKPYINIAFFGSILIFGIFTIATKGLELNSFQDFKLLFLLFVLVFLCYYSILSLFQIIRYAPIITIIDNQLIFGDTTYRINDIANIKFTGRITIPKKGIKSAMLNNKEGSIITFNDGTELYLFDHFYDEVHGFKSFLREKLNPTLSIEKENPIINLPNKVFRDIQFKRIRGIIIWLIPGYLIIKNLIVYPNSINTNGKIFTIAFSLVLIYYHSRYMNYFVLEKDDLIIKNENFFWKKEKIELNDIFEIVLEKEDKFKYDILNKKYLRIIYKDFNVDKYCADLLYEGTWINLKNEFEKINIPVRVEMN
jgi:hypothetical protein